MQTKFEEMDKIKQMIIDKFDEVMKDKYTVVASESSFGDIPTVDFDLKLEISYIKLKFLTLQKIEMIIMLN